jgi:hypothetical protein
MFEAPGIGQIQRNVDAQQHQQGCVAGGKRQAGGSACQRQRQHGDTAPLAVPQLDRMTRWRGPAIMMTMLEKQQKRRRF